MSIDSNTFNIYMTVASLDSSTGGPARSVPRLAEAIRNGGTIVQMFVNNRDSSAKQKKPQKFESQYNSAKVISCLGEAVRKLKEKKTDSILLHNHGIWLPFNHYACVTAQRFHIPLIISPRGMLEPWARNHRSFRKTLAWYLYQRRDLKAAAVLHATSEQEAKNLQALGLHIPIAVIPNGVDVPRLIKPVAQIKNTKTVLFLSRIHPIKGLINLVRAWAKIRPTEEWQVVIAGPDEGGHQAQVEREIRDNGLAQTFKFIGPIKDDDKWELYRSADLFVLPTHSENFGIVVAEALASGVPVITTKGAPWAELEEHKCGWWVDIGVEPLVKALNEAITMSPEELHIMGLRGRQLVEQNYSWEKIGKEMLSVYNWVLNGGTPPKCVMKD